MSAGAFDLAYYAFFAVLGLVWGSFANVVIWRFPRGESLVSPGSHCPTCEHPIRWRDNVPVIAWLALRGRCRDCGEPISWRYPAVELASGTLFALAAVKFGFALEAVVAAFLFWMLLVLSMIDLDTMRLPNKLVLVTGGGGAALALLAQVSPVDAVPLVGLSESGLLSEPLAVALLGVVLGMGPSLLIAGLYGLVRGRSGLGMGDVKLLGALGPFIGGYVLFAFFGGAMLGTIVGIPLMARATRADARAETETAKGAAAEREGSDAPQGTRGGAKIPFGPFLAVGGALAVLVGPEVTAWYLELVGISSIAV